MERFPFVHMQLFYYLFSLYIFKGTAEWCGYNWSHDLKLLLNRCDADSTGGMASVGSGKIQTGDRDKGILKEGHCLHCCAPFIVADFLKVKSPILLLFIKKRWENRSDSHVTKRETHSSPNAWKIIQHSHHKHKTITPYSKWSMLRLMCLTSILCEFNLSIVIFRTIVHREAFDAL